MARAVAVTVVGVTWDPLREVMEDASVLDAALKDHFGYDSFRYGQRDVVLAALARRDAAVFWTTGAGKSLCYQLPAVYSGKTVLVVSPLISLMQDQVHRFNAPGPQLPVPARNPMQKRQPKLSRSRCPSCHYLDAKCM